MNQFDGSRRRIEIGLTPSADRLTGRKLHVEARCCLLAHLIVAVAAIAASSLLLPCYSLSPDGSVLTFG